MLDFLIVVLTAGAVARITRLITADFMPFLEALRHFMQRVPFFGAMFHDVLDSEGKPTGKVVGCDWCVSVYVAGATVPVAYHNGVEPWFVIGAGIATASLIAGWLAALEPEA